MARVIGFSWSTVGSAPGTLAEEEWRNSFLLASFMAFSMTRSRVLCLWDSAFSQALEAFGVEEGLEETALLHLECPGSEGPAGSDEDWLAPLGGASRDLDAMGLQEGPANRPNYAQNGLLGDRPFCTRVHSNGGRQTISYRGSQEGIRLRWPHNSRKSRATGTGLPKSVMLLGKPSDLMQTVWPSGALDTAAAVAKKRVGKKPSGTPKQDLLAGRSASAKEWPSAGSDRGRSHWKGAALNRTNRESPPKLLMRSLRGCEPFSLEKAGL